MKTVPVKLNIVLYAEAAGFLLIIILLWLDELLDLPHHLLGAAATPVNYIESLFESILVLMLAIMTGLVTRHMLKKIHLLEGILPICSFCKKIRTEKDEWQQLESYIDQHSEARFSHSICPDCVKKYYPENTQTGQS